MTVYWYGGGPADWAMDLVTVDGTTLIPQMQPGATITCHSAQVGGDQYKDLALADGTPVEQITAAPGDTVYGPGTWPRFRGPVLSMWFSINDGPRVLVVSTDLPDVLQQALAAAQAAQAAASASAASAATLAGSSSVAGHLAAPDPHPQYANEQRGDARYVRAGDVGMVAPLQEPQQKLTFSETPAADDANMREIWVRHSDLITRLVAWENERGYPRREQVPGALWDNLYVAVAAYNGTGRAYAVQVRGIDGIRRDAGGFDAAGRPITSDQAWTPITSVDPDSTGDYAASTDVGPAPLAARWESNDVVRLQGRITAADVTDGDALAELPAGYHPCRNGWWSCPPPAVRRCRVTCCPTAVSSPAPPSPARSTWPSTTSPTPGSSPSRRPVTGRSSRWRSPPPAPAALWPWPTPVSSAACTCSSWPVAAPPTPSPA
ncbi:hypothetical protein GCM10029963_53110 [Micromonospora andamanensis]